MVRVIVLCILTPSIVLAQVPESVRLLHPSCRGAIDWPVLESALRVELRSMGSDLAEGEQAQARLSLDLGCTTQAHALVAVLTDVASDRSLHHALPIGDPSDPQSARVLAVALSELVRARYAELVLTSPPEPEPPPPRPDPEELRFEIARAVRQALPPPAPEPAPLHPPSWFADLALGIATCPMGPYATGQARVAISAPIWSVLRGAVEIAGGLGGASDVLGDALLAEVGGGAALRVGHVAPDLAIEGGVRVDASWAHANGLPASGAFGANLDAFAFAIGLDARVRGRIEGPLWLLLAIDVGAALAGLDGRSEMRRVVAQLGPRLCVAVGVALALD